MKSIFQTFERAIKNDPDGSRKDQFKAFLNEVTESPKLIEALAEDYFERMYAQWKLKHDPKLGHRLVGTPATQRRFEASAAKRQERAEQVASAARATVGRIVERVRKIMLMDMVTPLGKKLRDCTGAELAKCGGFFTELSRHLKPTQVADKHLNEADCQSVLSRYEGGKRRSAGAEMHA